MQSKVNACANFIASRLFDSQKMHRDDSQDYLRFALDPNLEARKAKSQLRILPIHCDVLRSTPLMTEVFERVDAVLVVAVDDERVRYAAAFLARARSTPTVMMGVYSGGWACESVLEGIDDPFPCHGCSSASLGRIGVALERHCIPYLGQSIHSEVIDQFDADSPLGQSTAEPSVLHVSIAAAHGITARTQPFGSDVVIPVQAEVAQRMGLPSMAEPPAELCLECCSVSERGGRRAS